MKVGRRLLVLERIYKTFNLILNYVKENLNMFVLTFTRNLYKFTKKSRVTIEVLINFKFINVYWVFIEFNVLKIALKTLVCIICIIMHWLITIY